MPIRFFFTELKNIPIKRKQLKAFIKSIFLIENKFFASLNFIFCSDDYLFNINKKYLNHDYYTDILTFDISETNNLIIGEVYISLDRVKDNAIIQKATFKEELHRVIFHGVLHLCGYKDKSKNDKAKMMALENKYLKLYFPKRST